MEAHVQRSLWMVVGTGGGVEVVAVEVPVEGEGEVVAAEALVEAVG